MVPKRRVTRVDLRLGLLRKADDLGVAAVLEIENAVVAPAVLVVANQVAVGVGGKRGLAGAGEAEEDGHVAVVADVGGAMHGQHAFQRQQEVEHGEDGLLDFAGVVRAPDNGQALAEIEDDEGVGAGAVHHGRSQEAGHHFLLFGLISKSIQHEIIDEPNKN